VDSVVHGVGAVRASDNLPQRLGVLFGIRLRQSLDLFGNRKIRMKTTIYILRKKLIEKYRLDLNHHFDY